MPPPWRNFMKMRNGFVSNSSSSSFVVYGATIEKDELLEALLEKFPDLEVERGEDGEIFLEETDIYNIIWDVPDAEVQSLSLAEYDDLFMICRPLAEIEENETLAQFKSRVHSALDKIGIDEEYCSIISGVFDASGNFMFDD